MIDLSDPAAAPDAVIEALGLLPHPEGGHFRETWRDPPSDADPRGAGTAILFLLRGGERSHWHRVDAAELWLWQAGAPLLLRVETESTTLGPAHGAGERLQRLVPRFAWQSAASLGRWTLCSCVVAPAFQFAGFELAPPDWEPSGG